MMSVDEVPAHEACALIEASSFLAFRCPPEEDWRDVDGQGLIAERAGRPVGAVLVSADTITKHAAPADYELVVIGASDPAAALRLLSKSVLELGGEWVADCITEHCVGLVKHIARRRGWHVRVETKNAPIEELPVDDESLLSRDNLVRFARGPLTPIPEEESADGDAYELWGSLSETRRRAIIDDAVVVLRDGRSLDRHLRDRVAALEATRGTPISLASFREMLLDELTNTNIMIVDGEVVDWDRDQAELDGKALRYDARHPGRMIVIEPVTSFFGLAG